MGRPSVRYRAAAVLARLAARLSRLLLHGSGNVIGGAVLLRLARDAVAARARGHRITLVTGTNGKSTTTAMITAALRTDAAVATNADGANTPNGLAWTIATSACDDVVLEVDEAWLPWAVRMMRPATVVLLNLTRDQLHRKPEIWPMAEAWRRAMREVPRVVAAADDPAVVWASRDASEVIYVGTGAEWTADSALCPRCKELLRDRTAAWWCPCGFARPAYAVSAADGRVVVDGTPLGGEAALPGSANLANAAMAVAAVRDRVPPERALAAISSDVQEVAGRYLEVVLEGRRVRLLLAKNPAGWQVALGMLRDGASTLLAFSADGIDGRDTSWLYDVSFDRLRGRRVAVIGPRGTDLVVRLHLDGIETGAAGRSLREGLEALPLGEVDVAATYGAFQAIRRELDVV